MRRNASLIPLVFLALASAASAQEPDLIPRRIYVSPSTGGAAQDAPQLKGAADALFAAVAARTPLVRVDSAALASSRLEVAIKPEGAGYRVSAVLFDQDRQAASREAVLARDSGGFAGYATFVRETADAFAPLLPLMRPQVVTGDASQETRYRDVADETDFVSQLARSWEITFWAGGLTEQYHEPLVERPGQLDVRTVPVLPFVFDAAWYYSRNGGLVASLFFDFGDYIGLGTLRSGDLRLDKASSTNLFLLPGVGVTYRTLSRVSAQFATVFYFGPVHVSADDPIPGIADAGEEVWTYYLMMSLSSVLSWNITPRISVKTRMSASVDMLATFFNELSSRETYAAVLLQFFTLGVAYRL